MMKIQNTHKGQSIRRKTILVIAILASYSTGCGASPTELPATEVLEISSATPLPLPRLTPARTATPIRPTLIPSQTPTLSPQEYFTEVSRNWRVAFFLESTNQICAMHGDGSGRVCLDLNDDNFSKGYPVGGFLALSSDGTKVAYATECNIYIWTIGENVTPLRNGRVCGIFRELKWSPDGNFITYISEELERGCPVCQAVFGDVFIDSLDGKIHRALTADLTGWSYDPDWSPDGKSITFTNRRVIQDSQNNYAPVNTEIFVVSTEGNNPIDLTNHSAGDFKPQWSPDGMLIAFLSDRRGSELFDLYVMNTDGSEVRRVAELGLNLIWPYSSYPITWLPDNRFILHNDTLYDTLTGESEVIRLPFVSIYASWLMTSEAVKALPAPHCAEEWSQLRPGIQAVVAGGPNDPPNRVRSAPGTSADIITQIYPGHMVHVLEGPVCADGLVFWKVESEAIPGGMGWTAEGDGKEYWLEP